MLHSLCHIKFADERYYRATSCDHRVRCVTPLSCARRLGSPQDAARDPDAPGYIYCPVGSRPPLAWEPETWQVEPRCHSHCRSHFHCWCCIRFRCWWNPPWTCLITELKIQSVSGQMIELAIFMHCQLRLRTVLKVNENQIIGTDVYWVRLIQHTFDWILYLSWR